MAKTTTDTARDHLERAVAWLTTYKHDDVSADTRMGAARVEVRHALELLDAIPPRQPTEDQRDAARYRWLRQNPTYMGWEHDFAPERFDRVIDGEMADKDEK